MIEITDEMQLAFIKARCMEPKGHVWHPLRRAAPDGKP